MKKIILIIALLFIAVGVNAADVQICITIPDAQVARLQAGFLEVRPIPDDDNDGNPDYTLKQWARINILNYINDTAVEGNRRIKEKAGRDSTDESPMAE